MWNSPRNAKVRWVVITGFVIRLVIAPLTSWAVDTPGFVLSSASIVYSGNPYAATTWFNPPLAPYLAEPFIGPLVVLGGPQSLLVSVPTIVPVSIATGVDASVFPTPAALLAWKIPLIASDLGVTVLLLRIGRARSPDGKLDWMAAAWFLNPLVIWASSVHGEVDTLAILFVLLAIVQATNKHWLSAGLALGLAIFAKGYPIALLPVFAALALADGSAVTPSALAERARSVLRWTSGLAISIVPFLYILPQTAGALLSKAGSPTYGGISVLGVFNAASPRIPGLYAQLTTSASTGAAVFDVMRALAALAVVGASIATYFRARKATGKSEDRADVLGAGCLLAGLAIFISDSAPQPENLVGLLPLVLISGPLWSGRLALWAYVALSVAGLMMYWSFLTPFAMFYPLAWWLGPGSISWVNQIAIAYVSVPGLRGGLWLAAGLIGGGTALALGAFTAVRFIVRPFARALKRGGGSGGMD